MTPVINTILSMDEVVMEVEIDTRAERWQGERREIGCSDRSADIRQRDLIRESIKRYATISHRRDTILYQTSYPSS